jgi:hypothetical protein
MRKLKLSGPAAGSYSKGKSLVVGQVISPNGKRKSEVFT